MAYLTAKMTYPSHRTFTFKTQDEKPTVYYERGYFQFHIQTFPGLTRSEEGEAGLKLTFEQATARALADALNEMHSRDAKAP